MMIRFQNFPRQLAVAALAVGMAIPAAQADENRSKYGGENRGKPLQPAQVNAKWKQECSSCHVAYAPGLLPAESWRKVMEGLDKHFGTDASLTPEESREITGFLVGNASNRWSAATAPLKISETGWFKSKHDAREVPAALWKNPLVKSPANCQACHTEAERGDFSERNIKLPK
ncbi:MAG: diheme cytochrome c [Nitrosomonadales bacterium]|nr:diheme cytochrome c [Nitrosomonadales bacterium]